MTAASSQQTGASNSGSASTQESTVLHTLPENPCFTLTIGDDGVALLVLDVPGEPVNTFFPEMGRELEAHLARIESDDAIRAVVFASGKKDAFFAGAKIDLVTAVATAGEAAELSRGAQAIFAKLEASKKPVIAAIDGACLGGGLEAALACTYRIATSNRKTTLGLPEVQLGLLPGAGGTQRLPALLGIRTALDLILTGRQLKADKARRIGLVDEVVPPTILLDVAKKRALELANGKLRVKRQREQIGELFNDLKDPKKAPDALQTLALEENPLGRKLLFRKAREGLLKKTGGHYPAQEKALEAVRIGAEKGAGAGYDAEARFFGELVVSPVSKRLVEIFFATTALRKDTGVDVPVKPLKVKKVGVLGAGLMGSGVAFVSAARAGHEVRLRERDDAALGRGLAAVHAQFDEGVKKKRLTVHERNRQAARVTGCTDWSGFRNVDLVVEAVFEDLALKQQLLREAEEHLPEHAVFASNTSSLPIAQIAAASKRPERVLGMHYFSPVPKMPLLEIIVHDGTDPQATATAVAVGKAQGKTVIVVRDGPGFYTTRILAPYLNEAAYLLGEGARVEDVDAVLTGFGFPVGPVTLLDEVGVDVGAKVSSVLENAFGERLKAPEALAGFVDAGRLGRKSKKGFYLYGEAAKKAAQSKKAGKSGKPVDESAYDLLPGGPKRRSFPNEEILDRVLLPMVNEAARCLEEGILRSARDGDIGAVFGLGFPPFRGGPFRYVDAVGAADVVRRLERLEAQHGSRFTPAPLLRELAGSGKRFHG